MAIYVPWLVDAARMATAGTGKQVIASPGWQSRGHGGLRVLEVVVGHHTATPESAPGDYPSLNVVQNGRAGLAGPLAQYGLGRSGNVYVIAAGRSYHAGASAYAGYLDLNDEAIGIEAEDSGDGRWNNEQLFMYPRLVGACLHYMRRDVGRYASHRTIAVPAGRKPDPTGISDDWMRQQVAAFLQGGGDMGYADDVLEWMQRERLNKLPAGHRFKNKVVGDMLLDATDYAAQGRDIAARLEVQLAALAGALSDDEAKILAAVREGTGGDPAAIAAHLAPLLLDGGLVARLSDEDAAKLSDVVNDDADRRAAARANTDV